MAVILKNSVILHIPKTGGNYVREVLDHNKIPYYTTGRHPCILSQNLFNREISSHCIPHGHECFEGRVHKLVFVRHPLEWYRSYWSFRVMNKPGNEGAKEIEYWRTSDVDIGYHGYAKVDEITHDDNFELWINNILREFKFGPYSKFVSYYCAFASVIGKTENLKEHLATFLHKYEGVSELDFNIPLANVTTRRFKDKAIYVDAQAKRICELEKLVVNRFYKDPSEVDSLKDFPEQIILL